jgi:hypothetical protein
MKMKKLNEKQIEEQAVKAADKVVENVFEDANLCRARAALEFFYRKFPEDAKEVLEE